MAKKNRIKGFFGEFREFILRGNVLDMAVGVIIATAFGKITTSLVNDVFMPFIAYLTGGSTSSFGLNFVLIPEVVDEITGEVVTPAVSMNFDAFISTVIDFVLIAFIVFIVVKVFNTVRERAENMLKKKEEEAPAVEEVKAPSTEELLSEILEEIKKK